jgi:non-specific serine/threonine protein kinase
MEPGSDLQKLLKAIVNQDPSLNLTPRIEAAVARKTNNLPLSLTSFVGRISEVAEVKRLCSESRLVTLTGVGGIGKTRLAVQVAGELTPSFRDGTWVVELAPVSDPSQVPQTLAAALGVREQPGLPIADSLIAYLERRHLLLLLDNCEQVVEGSAKLVYGVLRNCPDLRILATSREPFGIAGEATWRVPSLALPDPERPPPVHHTSDYGALTLFADRAATVLGSFELTDTNWPLVVQICQRLDGIPLAIELAAAKLRALSLEQIASRLNDRFGLLTGGYRTALPRQQTLEATIDWSYDLLPASQQGVLRRLSVFANGFNLGAAESVCATSPDERSEVLAALTGLIDKSLLLRSTSNEEARYTVLETIGQYASRKLVAASESASARQRHHDWFVELAEQGETQLRGPRQKDWFARLETERENLRAAAAWSLEFHQAECLRLPVAMGYFWLAQGLLTEGREQLAHALARSADSSPTLRAKAMASLCDLVMMQGDFPYSSDLARESLEISRRVQDAHGMGQALLGLGFISIMQDEYEPALAYLEQSLALFRETGDDWYCRTVLSALARVAWVTGRYVTARVLRADALSLSRKMGDQIAIGEDLLNLGIVELSDGEPGLAATLLEESLATFKHADNKPGGAKTLHQLGIAARAEKQYVKATSFLEESLTVLHDVDDKALTSYCLHELGIVALRLGDAKAATENLSKSLILAWQMKDKWAIAKSLEAFAALANLEKDSFRAAKLLGAAGSLRAFIGAPVEPFERDAYEALVASVRTGSGEADRAKAWAEGRAITVDESVALALAEYPGAPVAFDASLSGQGRNQHVEAKASRAGSRGGLGQPPSRQG